MALVPSLSLLLFHTLRWRAKAPWEQPPRGFNIYQPALITKTEGTACLSLTDLTKNRYIFPQFSCPASNQKLTRLQDGLPKVRAFEELLNSIVNLYIRVDLIRSYFARAPVN